MSNKEERIIKMIVSGEMCYDCGSTIENHHTALCELCCEAEGDILDLPSKNEHSQHWSGEIPEHLK